MAPKLLNIKIDFFTPFLILSISLECVPHKNCGVAFARAKKNNNAAVTVYHFSDGFKSIFLIYRKNVLFKFAPNFKW